MNEQEEEIEIQAALNTYEEDVIDRQRSLSDLYWTKQTNQESYEMYISFEQDMKKNLDNGLITESEYLYAYANRELYRIKLLINDIDILIYNNEVKLLFCRDSELQE